jgi:hypothetical protein
MKFKLDLSASSVYCRLVNIETITKLRSELNQEKKKALDRIQKQSDLLDELERLARESKNETNREPGKTVAKSLVGVPRVELADAVKRGARELEEFTKRDLNGWIERNHPGYTFNIKSLDKIIQTLIKEDKTVELLRQNVGNRQPAVYKWKK